jgi:hypothetical protein
VKTFGGTSTRDVMIICRREEDASQNVKDPSMNFDERPMCGRSSFYRYFLQNRRGAGLKPLDAFECDPPVIRTGSSNRVFDFLIRNILI